MGLSAAARRPCKNSKGAVGMKKPHSRIAIEAGRTSGLEVGNLLFRFMEVAAQRHKKKQRQMSCSSRAWGVGSPEISLDRGVLCQSLGSKPCTLRHRSCRTHKHKDPSMVYSI